MENKNLPTEELKKYGIINEDNSRHQKISKDDFERFTNEGYTLIVQDKEKRVSFQLTKDKQLDVKHYIIDKPIDDILEQAKDNLIQYAIEKQLDEDNGTVKDETLKVFIYNSKENNVSEVDFLKKSKEITDFVLEQKDIEESKKYKAQLEMLKGFLQDKIDKFPEVAKYIANDMNIVSKNISRIDDATPNEEQAREQKNTKVQLNVNDPDLYQDANQEREDVWEREQEQKTRFKR
ncbi:hypothetical protein [Riemerella anatipestifer]|uniref:DUF3945 domain-containing protein n=1 Tax=Riemerella anatipestifer TaxID=34085 RepID=A0AAP6LJ60_RIEAN|nr:hypothetical protein [Riemerella anatipestifer]MCO7354042.1 hypothetical protein [Riemerella anatipestifer]MCU7559127.1 hypothetical protein [Riemerella anatipestifer]MCU7571142.1 hypothetical protein [Riemerella anatipestifer]MCU7597581.1 hypothetical protein [Riemerella anatipestifer]MCW0488324.1 hypothetical protein [Riemerella anatipestifer]